MKNSMILGCALFVVGCGRGPVTSVGQNIWSAEVMTITAEDKGDAYDVPTPPAGSACGYGAGKFTLSVATSELSWTRCDTGLTPYKSVNGSRTLSGAELKELTTSLEKLTIVANSNSCGADKETLLVTVTTDSGQQEYADSVYSCRNKDKPVLESNSLDAALAEFKKLAK